MVEMEDWCLDHNQPEATCVCKQQPKCVRVLLTAMFVDNSSVVMDVKSPAEFAVVLESLNENSQLAANYEVVSSPTILDVHFRTQISKEAAIVSYYPSKWRG